MGATFRREAEAEADGSALCELDLLARAGLRSRGLADFFERLERESGGTSAYLIDHVDVVDALGPVLVALVHGIDAHIAGLAVRSGLSSAFDPSEQRKPPPTFRERRHGRCGGRAVTRRGALDRLAKPAGDLQGAETARRWTGRGSVAGR